MRRALLLIPLLAVALLALAPVGVAGAESPTAVGWWSQDPTAAEQPDGGFQVAAAGGQPVSIAALRFTVPDGATTGTLELQEAEGGVVSPATALQACPTADQWEPANPGAFEDAPEADCTAPIDLTRDEATLTWSGTVPAAAAGSLVIVPSETASGGAPLDPGFQLTFTGADLQVATGGAGGAGGAIPTPPSSSAYKAPGGSSSFTGGSSSFAAPGAVTPTTTATSAPAPTTATTVAPVEGEAIQPFETDGGGGGADQPWERLLFLVPLSALVGVAFVYGKRILRQRGVLEEA
jgi:hypothetical protein